MNYQYSYLIGDLVLLIIWFALFLFRKDVRREMLIISLIFGFFGVLVQFVYITDWWHPLTITNTKIGVEDFLLGFVTAGIASVIYEEVFRRRIKIKKANKNKEFKQDINFLFLILVGIILFFGSFYFLNLNSFYASILALLIPAIIIWVRRKDLISDSLASGFLLMLISFLAFLIPEYITPGIVKFVWYLENLSGIVILKAPLEDLIWFFLIGLYIGPLYEYWREGKLVDER